MVPEHRSVRVSVRLDGGVPSRRLRYATAVFGELLWPFGACSLVTVVNGESDNGEVDGGVSAECELMGLPASLVHITVYEQVGPVADPTSDPRLGTRAIDLSELGGEESYTVVF